MIHLSSIKMVGKLGLSGFYQVQYEFSDSAFMIIGAEGPVGIQGNTKLENTQDEFVHASLYDQFGLLEATLNNDNHIMGFMSRGKVTQGSFEAYIQSSSDEIGKFMEPGFTPEYIQTFTAYGRALNTIEQKTRDSLVESKIPLAFDIKGRMYQKKA